MSFTRRSDRALRAAAGLCLLTGWIACSPGSCSPEAGSPTGGDGEGGAGPEPAVGEGAAALGDGFAVWESNRTGDWRLWYRRLDGSGLRQLVPDEEGRHHCCALVSPDGTRLIYLSQPGGWEEYPEAGTRGELRLLDLLRGHERVLVAEARTYDRGNRAAVWRSGRELIHIGGDGRTYLLDLSTGDSRPLTDEPREELGWLIDPTLSHAATGKTTFSLYDRERRRVLQRRELGGCEPYFSPDGRWGYWVAGAGGPIDKIDLETREVSTLLSKNDPRLGAKGYLYFPTVSRDGTLLAFGASSGGHSHFESDYDAFVVPVDPATLEPSGSPVRLTDHPATDRYPDVHLAPLPLGRHRGEAPFTVEPAPPGLTARGEWDWGDGTRGTGRLGRHRYREPGIYRVEMAAAEHPDRMLRGLVVVAQARPPRVVGQELRGGGRELHLLLDEPVLLAEDFAAALASGLAVSGTRLAAEGRVLVLELAGEIAGPDRLTLRGVTDRAQRPNRMPEVTLQIAPPAWPATRDSLVFLWQSADSPNLVPDPELGADRTYALEASGRARLDRHFAMLLGDGAFVAPPEAAQSLLEAARGSNQLTLEATLTPAEAAPQGLRRMVTFSSGMDRRNFTLGQEGRHLVVRMRTGPTGPNADRPQVTLFELTPGETVHVAVTYSPGRLRAYRNGEPVVETGEVVGSFSTHWQFRRLLFGQEWRGGGEWSGTLEGVALYSRALPPEVVRESWLRYRRILEARSEVPRSVVRARLVERAQTPTLREISPYRQALAVFGYEVLEPVDGPPAGERVRVARWVILDGEPLPAARLRPGREERLTLEPFADNPQLEGSYLAEGAAGIAGSPLYYAVEP